MTYSAAFVILVAAWVTVCGANLNPTIVIIARFTTVLRVKTAELYKPVVFTLMVRLADPLISVSMVQFDNAVVFTFFMV